MLLFRLMLFVTVATALAFIKVPSASADEDASAKIFTEACSPCHSAKVRPLDNIRMTREQWKETIDRMIDQGAEVPKGKMSELLDYLFRTHGPTSAAPDAGKK